ncbi:hypothetical protein HAX54_036699, partial [Datura stramonium]|nr:hypothetical protein [Datura stramonium]
NALMTSHQNLLSTLAVTGWQTILLDLNEISIVEKESQRARCQSKGQWRLKLRQLQKDLVEMIRFQRKKG